RIVGALPLQFERHTIRRLPVKKASPMGSGWGASSLLVSPDTAAIASTALVDACHDRSLPRWQMLHIAHWRGERPAQECFLRSLQARGIRTREIRVAEPFL